MRVFRVQGFHGLGCWVKGLGFKVQGFGFRVLNLRLEGLLGLSGVFRVWGFIVERLQGSVF